MGVGSYKMMAVEKIVEGKILVHLVTRLPGARARTKRTKT